MLFRLSVFITLSLLCAARVFTHPPVVIRNGKMIDPNGRVVRKEIYYGLIKEHNVPTGRVRSATTHDLTLPDMNICYQVKNALMCPFIITCYPYNIVGPCEFTGIFYTCPLVIPPIVNSTIFCNYNDGDESFQFSQQIAPPVIDCTVVSFLDLTSRGKSCHGSTWVNGLRVAMVAITMISVTLILAAFRSLVKNVHWIIDRMVIRPLMFIFSGSIKVTKGLLKVSQWLAIFMGVTIVNKHAATAAVVDGIVDVSGTHYNYGVMLTFDGMGDMVSLQSNTSNFTVTLNEFQWSLHYRVHKISPLWSFDVKPCGPVVNDKYTPDGVCNYFECKVRESTCMCACVVFQPTGGVIVLEPDASSAIAVVTLNNESGTYRCDIGDDACHIRDISPNQLVVPNMPTMACAIRGPNWGAFAYSLIHLNQNPPDGVMKCTPFHESADVHLNVDFDENGNIIQTAVENDIFMFVPDGNSYTLSGQFTSLETYSVTLIGCTCGQSCGSYTAYCVGDGIQPLDGFSWSSATTFTRSVDIGGATLTYMSIVEVNETETRRGCPVPTLNSVSGVAGIWGGVTLNVTVETSCHEGMYSYSCGECSGCSGYSSTSPNWQLLHITATSQMMTCTFDGVTTSSIEVDMSGINFNVWVVNNTEYSIEADLIDQCRLSVTFGTTRQEIESSFQECIERDTNGGISCPKSCCGFCAKNVWMTIFMPFVLMYNMVTCSIPSIVGIYCTADCQSRHKITSVGGFFSGLFTSPFTTIMDGFSTLTDAAGLGGFKSFVCILMKLLFIGMMLVISVVAAYLFATIVIPAFNAWRKARYMNKKLKLLEESRMKATSSQQDPIEVVDEYPGTNDKFTNQDTNVLGPRRRYITDSLA